MDANHNENRQRPHIPRQCPPLHRCVAKLAVLILGVSFVWASAAECGWQTWRGLDGPGGLSVYVTLEDRSGAS